MVFSRYKTIGLRFNVHPITNAADQKLIRSTN